jgi:hypothetical protein
MNKLLFILPVLLFFAACEENFSPEGEYSDHYSVNLLLDTDSLSHIAVIKKSYEDEGDNMSVDVTGAQIYIYDGVEQLNFVEIENPGFPSNGFARYYYRIDNWSPEFRKNYLVSVQLQNGPKLTSDISVFKRFSFVSFGSDKLVPPADPDQQIININWEEYPREIYFESKLFIIYYLQLEGQWTMFKHQVPISFVESGDTSVPFYYSFSNKNFYITRMSAIDRSMEELSGDDPDKSKYLIHDMSLEVTIFDEALSAYLITTSNKPDEFSLSQYETNYSNVRGGYGIVGVHKTTDWRIKFDSDYIRSFGYSPSGGNRP